MKNQFGLEITHVPYRATPQSIQDIAAGHIALGWAEAGASIPLIKDGKLRALAVSSRDAAAAAARRAAARRGRARAGLRGGVVAHAARAGENAARHRRQAARRDEARSWPSRSCKQKIETIGLIPFDTPSVEDLRAYRRAEQEKWGALVKKLGLEGSQ